jgi:hypothetical protein
MNDQRGKPRRKTTRQSPKTATRKTTSRLKRRVNRMPAFVRQSLTADFAHRGQPYRRIVITRFGHRDRSGATQAVGRSVGGFGLGSPA